MKSEAISLEYEQDTEKQLESEKNIYIDFHWNGYPIVDLENEFKKGSWRCS